ncbi:MAG: right-handed parallel beta-helix repeat-containing protein, partial [Candidatus Aenigmarchaeota archaeon]|nr:right-handed parallel beta-helix repeat-containing protein [Candidatus Aenigmarchaeota archaeon]
IKNCIVENWDMGIKFSSADTGTILNNNIRSNNVHGIYLTYNSDNNVIKNNRIYENEKGMYLTSSCDSNIIFNNYFSDNYENVDAIGVNFWNTTNRTGTNIIGGPNIGGNYFSDYTGADTNEDGFGEEFYDNIGGQNKDYLPLAIPEVPTIFLSIGAMFLSLIKMRRSGGII